MDFITLWISALITSKRRSALRMSLGAAFGALFGVLSVIFIEEGLITYICCAAVSLIMCLISFGFCGSLFSLIKQTILVWGCGALLGGVMTALLSLGGGYSDLSQNSGGRFALLLALSIVAVYVTVRLICNTKGKKTVTVTATWKDKKVSFTALCDSGNLLRDPISGDPVIPVSEKIATKLLGKSITDSVMSINADELSNADISLRLIPHRCDGDSSLIGGFVPDSVTVISGNKKNRVKCILAPRKCELTYFAGCAATVPSSLLP